MMGRVKLLDVEYDVLKDENKVFDYDIVANLFTDFFLPYDYVLCDYAYGKLRLKGYYDSSNKKATTINDYSNVEDYIKNYCAYKCKYFILKKVKM